MQKPAESRVDQRAFAAIAVWLALSAVAPLRGEARDVPTVVAAADLQFALTDVASAFREETGLDVEISFGSSGNFYRQIQQGAPFEIYFSADEQYPLDLAAKGFARDEGVLYAIGRIVIIAPHGSSLTADAELADLGAALADGRIERFAIANPAHAPYGRGAEESLRHAGLWEGVRDKLVFGENVSQAAQFAMSGSAQGGIIAYSLALSPRVSAQGNFALIPEDWHTPLRQRMVLLRGAGETAERFYSYAQAPRARTILSHYGFVLPEE
jgi:molybdate transport system substrate-binding protein